MRYTDMAWPGARAVKTRSVKTYAKKYDGKVRAKDENKIAVNELLKDMGSVRGRANGHAIILDSEALLTTKNLIEAGYKANHIHIPNPFVYAKIKMKHANTSNILLSEFIEVNKRSRDLIKNTSLAFFDYMVTLDGNTEIPPPPEDIKKYFKYEYPSNDSIFAVTISLRKKSPGTCYDVNRLDSFITRYAHKYGYIAVKLPEGKAYNGMFYTIYRIFKS